MLHNDHVVNDVCLTLINEGTLYAYHRAMAFAMVENEHWIRYVAYLGLATYRKTPSPTLVNDEQIREIAYVLADYYKREIAEG